MALEDEAKSAPSDQTSTKSKSEARAHHIVPRCWLAGFTENGEKDGELWVTDIKREKQWPTNPGKIARIRDFYRVSHPELDPLMVENSLADMENDIAPILRSFGTKGIRPNDEEFEKLLDFMAIQWVRLPAFRPFALDVMGSVLRTTIEKDLETPETWKAAVMNAGLSPEDPGADYELMKAFHRSGNYSLSAETEWYMERAFKTAPKLEQALKLRYWRTAISERGNFVGSDTPIILEGPKGQIGFKSAEVIVYPVSRHVLLYGTIGKDWRHPLVNWKYISRMNTLSMLAADSQIFSHASDFPWLDENNKCQSDWKLFSKERILASLS